jgi:hypothetical protein
MTRVTVDPTTQAKLNNFTGILEVCDESGRTLGYFHPVVQPVDAGRAAIQSPFSKEEVERRRQQRNGRPLAEILERFRG